MAECVMHVTWAEFRAIRNLADALTCRPVWSEWHWLRGLAAVLGVPEADLTALGLRHPEGITLRCCDTAPASRFGAVLPVSADSDGR